MSASPVSRARRLNRFRNALRGLPNPRFAPESDDTAQRGCAALGPGRAKSGLLRLITFALLFLSLVACSQPATPTLAPGAGVPPTETCTPIPPETLPPEPVLPPASTPTPRQPISLENVNQVVQLGYLGRGPVGQVAWSPDGRSLAVAYSRGVSLYDAETLEQVRFWETYTPVPNLAFSPDGTLVAAGAGDQVRLWRVSDGTLQHTLTGHTGEVYSVSFSPLV